MSSALNPHGELLYLQSTLREELEQTVIKTVERHARSTYIWH